jgi:hypothetical protein
MSPRLEVELERGRYHPGDTVRGTIRVLEGGRSRGLDAVLEYREETEDYHEVVTSIPSGRLHDGDLAAGTSFEFELALPPDALPNCRSEHGRLYWSVDARSDELGRDIHARHRVDVRAAARSS